MANDDANHGRWTRDGNPQAAEKASAKPIGGRIAARLVVARSHGFASWQALRRHVRRLPGSGEPFFGAYRAVEARDPDGRVLALQAGIGHERKHLRFWSQVASSPAPPDARPPPGRAAPRSARATPQPFSRPILS